MLFQDDGTKAGVIPLDGDAAHACAPHLTHLEDAVTLAEELDVPNRKVDASPNAFMERRHQ
ncbi:hypothetical protein [Streptomyces sp. 6N106]|uniref:hypothetical protein n=1 Tax=Streptomyces sp. 6N106 TaxID=3457418 RepID=UPI003FD62E6B